MNCFPFGDVEPYAYCVGLHSSAEHAEIIAVVIAFDALILWWAWKRTSL